jgi:ureidoglycolate lyase
MKTIPIKPLTAAAFAPFGDIIVPSAEPSFQINRGMCDRFHDLARLEFVGANARANISLGRARPYTLPLELDMVERHPLGSQAFIPLSQHAFLVIVAPDDGNRPGPPQAFLTAPGQGVNYLRNTWHGVLTPLAEETVFVIVDRAGEGENLEEFFFDDHYLIGADLP